MRRGCAGELLLASICQNWDRIQQSRALIAKDGLILTEKTAAGVVKHKPHPALQIENSATQSLMRAWHLMGFDSALPPGMS